MLADFDIMVLGIAVVDLFIGGNRCNRGQVYIIVEFYSYLIR